MKWWFGKLIYNLASASMKCFTTTIVLYIIYTKTTPTLPLNWIIGITGIYWAVYPLIEIIFVKDELGEKEGVK